jgi:hypothetical protein
MAVMMSNFNPEDGGSMFLQNVAIYPQDCTLQQTSRPQSETVNPVTSFAYNR